MEIICPACKNKIDYGNYYAMYRDGNIHNLFYSCNVCNQSFKKQHEVSDGKKSSTNIKV